MPVAIERLHKSPSFQRLLEQSLASDAADAERQRREAIEKLAEIEAWHTTEIERLKTTQKVASGKVRRAEAALQKAKDEVGQTTAAVNRHWDLYQQRKVSQDRILSSTRPATWDDFLMQLQNELSKTRAAVRVRGSRGGPQFDEESNSAAVSARLAAIRKIVVEARQLSREFVGSSGENLVKIQELREKIPDASTLEVFAPTTESQLLRAAYVRG